MAIVSQRCQSVVVNNTLFRGYSCSGNVLFPRDLYGYPSVHGAVSSNRKSYGPVRCGFQKSKILRCGSVRLSGIVNPTVRFGFEIYPTVRFGAVFENRKSYGAVRCGFQKSEILRCGSVQF